MSVDGRQLEQTEHLPVCAHDKATNGVVEVFIPFAAHIPEALPLLNGYRQSCSYRWHSAAELHFTV